MESALRRGDALSRVQSRRAADGHEIHRTVIQKLAQIRVRLSAVLAAQPRDLLRVCSMNRGYLDSRNGAGGTRVSLRNTSAADQSDVRGHMACWGTLKRSKLTLESAIISEQCTCFKTSSNNYVSLSPQSQCQEGRERRAGRASPAHCARDTATATPSPL